MSTRARSLWMSLLALAVASTAVAQQWGLGASYGWFTDIEQKFRLDQFHSPNWEGWIESRLGEDVALRGTYGSMRVRGDNVGATIVAGGSPVVMPEYRDGIRYVTFGVSYLFAEGPFTTGLFAGIGGYAIRPEAVTPLLNPYRDQRERVFGWHAGVEGSLHVYRGLGLTGRLAYHGILSQTRRSLLVASTGAVYRF